jgi:hypothetical protein
MSKTIISQKRKFFKKGRMIMKSRIEKGDLVYSVLNDDSYYKVVEVKGSGWLSVVTFPRREYSYKVRTTIMRKVSNYIGVNSKLKDETGNIWKIVFFKEDLVGLARVPISKNQANQRAVKIDYLLKYYKRVEV